MAGFSQYPLQQAIYQALSADSTLASLVGGIYDRPPQGTAYPYVTIGDAQVTDASTKTTTGSVQLMPVHIWSREGGRKQAATIIERVYQLLHQTSLTVTGQALVSLRFTESSLLLGDDGWTYHGTATFRACLQAS